MNIHIALAGPAQAETVIRWLKRDVDEYGEHSGFYWNRDVIRRAAREHELMCMWHGRRIVGFTVCSSNHIALLEVRQAYRGIGLGRQLAEHAIEHRFAAGDELIRGKCSPRASQGFWAHLGFALEPFEHPHAPIKMTLHRQQWRLNRSEFPPSARADLLG